MKANRRLNVAVLVVLVAIILILCGDAMADFTFGPAQNLGPTLNTTSADGGGGTTSAGGLELYFCSDRPGGSGATDICVSKRQSVKDPWGPPANLGPMVNSPYSEDYPSLSSDGLTLYFSDFYSGSPRPGGLGGPDIWMTTRPSRSDPWTTPVNLDAPVNNSSLEISPTISGDGLTLVFTSNRNGGMGGWDLWMSTRAGVQDAWDPPVNLGPNVNSAGHDCECSLSADGLALFFCSNRPGGLGAYDLWVTTRKSSNDPWGPAVNLGPAVNTAANEGSAGVSADRRTLYFTSDRSGGLGGYDLWETPILPVVDFNGDEKVDIADLLRLIESWGKDDPAVDVGPSPWGNGVVDANDLEVLMGYWGKEVNHPALLACWKLDETSGAVAADSIGTNDGMLIGAPVWQPTGGKMGGALQCDAVDDGVTTAFVLDPSDGPFSVFAWVKGGGPGQAIVSQVNGVNWLMAGAPQGALMTELRGSGRNAKPLACSAVITDGAWHRVGFVRDGVNRILYVDGVRAAMDSTQTTLGSSTGGLYIGAGSKVAAGSFWSGLIDDVRIYNRTIQP
jgi:hypothetical protein